VKNFDRLLWAMSSPGTVFVTGAGFSKPVIPCGNDLIEKLANKYHEDIRAYPLDRPPASPLRDRSLASLNPFRRGRVSSKYPNRDILLMNIRESALTAFFEATLCCSFKQFIPANYAVMRFVPAPAIVFDFNLDGQ
jgi:hypothetical protein